MNPTRALRAAAAAATTKTTTTTTTQSYIPLIKFKGHHLHPSTPPPSKSTTTSSSTLSPQPHPASPSHTLPDSFAAYRQKSQQHGPLGGHSKFDTVPQKITGPRIVYGAVGARSGAALGAVEAPRGAVFDRSELPARFGRLGWSLAEIEAVGSGGASLW